MNQKKNRRLHIRTHQDCDGASVEGDGAQRHSGEVGRALRTGPRLDGGAGRRLGPARGPIGVEGGGGDGWVLRAAILIRVKRCTQNIFEKKNILIHVKLL